MDNAVRARRAARDALADIEPERLREPTAKYLAEASMTPSVLTLVSATTLDTAADTGPLAADVLVSRGFYLLARTETADRAVEVVRAFGRDQTRRRGAGAGVDVAALDRNLEADVFALAVAAGTTAVGVDPGEDLLNYAADLAREYEDDLPPPETALPETAADHILALASGDAPSAADP